jgi:hypothetical protein
MPSRRGFLGAVATGTTAATTGCFAAGSSDRTTTTTTVPSLDDGDRTRGAAAAISVERALSLDEDETHVESNDTIRYPATKSGGDVAAYGYLDVEEWTTLQAMFVAKHAIRDHFETALPSLDGVEVSGTERGGPETELDVAHLTYESDDGPADEPAVSADELVARTPKTVDVTVTFADETATGSYPVFVLKWTGEQMGERLVRPHPR